MYHTFKGVIRLVWKARSTEPRPKSRKPGLHSGGTILIRISSSRTARLFHDTLSRRTILFSLFSSEFSAFIRWASKLSIYRITIRVPSFYPVMILSKTRLQRGRLRSLRSTPEVRQAFSVNFPDSGSRDSEC
jgi:hypothetical protein